MNPTVEHSPSSQLLPGSVKEALVCGFLGVVVATGAYGITVLQAYVYFRNSSQGSTRMRYFVALLFVVDTASLVLVIRAGYEYLITDYGTPALLMKIPGPLALENATAALTKVLAQCFFSHHLWILSKRNLVLVGGVIVLALSSFGIGIALSVRLYTDMNILSFASTENRILVGLGNGFSVICDVAIVAGLCYYLHSKRTGFRRTESIIDRLIIYAVNRGTLTTICQTCEMIMAVALPGRLVFAAPFTFLGGRLYFITLLATLNAQGSMKQDGFNVVEVSTRALDRIKASRTGKEERQADGYPEGGRETTPTSVLDISDDKNMRFDDTDRSVDGDA